MSAEGRGLAGALRVRLALRRRMCLARAILWRAYPGVEVGRGARLGTGIRLHLEPGGRLVLGADCDVDDGVTLSVSRGAVLRIGPGAFLGHHGTLAAREALTIGRGTFLAELVSIRDHDHDPSQRPSAGASLLGPVVVGEHCWLAAKVTVTRGVTIGDGAVVGANAVVTKDLPADSVAVGVPARVIRSGIVGA